MADRGVDEEKRATLRRFAALGAAVPAGLAGTGTATAGDSNAREAIAGYLTTTPGAHFSKIRDDLTLGTGETQHHLRKLVSSDAIESREDGEYRRFFPSDRFDEFEQIVLGYLRRETPRRMLLALLDDPGMTGASLADAVGVSRPTISKHASALAEAGLLERDEGYRVRKPEIVIALLVRYADSFDEETVAFANRVDRLITHDP